jgi:hypothetical protein
VHAVSRAAKANFCKTDNAGFDKQLEAWDKIVLKPRPRFHDVYDLKTKIRKGSFATVWECERKDTGEKFAVKIIKREGLKPSDDEAVMNEVAVVRSLEHENIVQFIDFYEEPDYFFLVMEYMTGGDVFDRIVEKTQYTEKDARDLIKILVKAVEYMHSKGVAHRDLKPQNLLLKVGWFRHLFRGNAALHTLTCLICTICRARKMMLILKWQTLALPAVCILLSLSPLAAVRRR